MKLHFNQFVLGRPQFSNSDTDSIDEDAPQQSFLSQNPLLKKLAPSTPRYRIIEALKWLGNLLIRPFLIKRPDGLKEHLTSLIRPKDQTANLTTPLSFGDILDHYRKYLEADQKCPESLKSSLRQLNKDLQTIEKIGKMPGNNGNVGENKSKQEIAKEAFVQKNLKELQALKPGQSHLFLLNRLPTKDGSIDGDLFCIVTKEDKNYALRIVGSPSAMEALAEQSIHLAGKDKIARQVQFDDIPPEELFDSSLLENLMNSWADASGIKPTDLNTLLLDLDPYRKSNDSLDDLTTKSKRSTHLFWNLVHAFPQASGEKGYNPSLEKEEKRIKLRAELLSVFEVFQRKRNRLNPASASFQQFKEALAQVSANTLQAYQKKYISLSDLEEVRKELDVIEKKLAAASARTQNTRFSKMAPKPYVLQNTTAELLALHSPQKVEVKAEMLALPDRTEGVLPTEDLEPLTEAITIPLTRYTNIETKEEFLKTLNNLKKQWDSSSPAERSQKVQKEILQFFKEVPFEIFKSKYNDHIFDNSKYITEAEATDSFWWDIKEQEACDTIQTIHDLCTKITTQPRFLAELNQEEFESIFKATAFGAFWLSLESKQRCNQLLHLTVHFWQYQAHDPQTNLKKHVVGHQFHPHNYHQIQASSRDFWNEMKQINSAQENSGPKSRYHKEMKELVKNQLELLDKITGKSQDLPNLFLTSKWNHWLRPVSNPFLVALYRQAAYWTEKNRLEKIIDEDENHKDKTKEQVGEKFGLMTPEAFQTEPEEILSYFLNDLNQATKDLEVALLSEDNKLDSPEPMLQPIPLTFTLDEQKRLLKLLRLHSPQVELLAFMHECPHLLRNADVRNFFDALFFNGSLIEFLHESSALQPQRRKSLVESIPSQIQKEIDRLEEILEKTLEEDPIEDLSLAKERLDTLLYFYEMHEKLRQIYKSDSKAIDHFEDHQEALVKWRKFAIETPAFFDSASYAARIHLRTLLISGEISKEDLPEALLNYSIIHGNPHVKPENIDPTFEYKLNAIWRDVTETIGKNPNSIGEKNWNALLDHHCYLKNLPLDGSSWKHVKDLIFQNQKYEVNLETFSASLHGNKGNFDSLPPKITQSSLFQSTFKGLELTTLRVTKQSLNHSHTIYSFLDASGLPCQIEEEKGGLTFYKEITFNGTKIWVQSISKDEFDSNPKKALEAMTDVFGNNKSSLFSKLRSLQKVRTALSDPKPKTLPCLFDNGLYFDPNDKFHAFSLDNKGEVIFELFLKNHSNGMVIDRVTDHRTTPPSEGWQVNHAGTVRELDFLYKMENKEHVLLWSQSGTLKKVELPRFGLTFTVEGDQLKCTQGDLKGYALKHNATLEEKNGFPHALVLEHPNRQKPKKLLVPEADALVPKDRELKSKAGFFARLKLYIEELIKIFKFLTRTPTPTVSRKELKIDEEKESIALSIFDLRPCTNEIIGTEKNSMNDSMQLVKQALKTKQHHLAKKILKALPIDSAPMDQKTLKVLTDFIHQPQGGTGAEAALKLKLCIRIKKALRKHKRSTKSVRHALDKLMIEQGKLLLAAGRALSADFQLNEEERLQLGAAARRENPKFYQDHLLAYFLKKDDEFDTDAVPAEEDDPLNDLLEAWKNDRKQQDIASRITALEDNLQPLTDADLVHEIKRLPKDQEIPLLFSPKEIDSLFDVKKVQLPVLKLSTDTPGLSPCEKKALEEFQADIDQFSAEETKRPRYTIKASPAQLKKFADKTVLPKKFAFEKQAAKLKQQIQANVLKADDAEEQLAIYARTQPTASFDEIRLAFTQGTLENLKAKKRLPSTLDLAQLKKDLAEYFDVLTRYNAVSICVRLIDEIEEIGSKKNPEQWESLSTALYRILTIKRHYDADEDPRLLTFEAQQFINFKALEGGLDQLDLLEAILKDPYAVIQAPTGSGKSAVLSVMRSLLKSNGKNLVVQKVLPTLFQPTYEKLSDVLGDLHGVSVYPLRFNLKMRMSKVEIVKDVDNQGNPIEVSQEVSIFQGMYYEMLNTMKNHGCILTDYKSFPLLEEKFFKLGEELREKTINNQPFTRLDREHYTYLRKILLLHAARGDENMDEFDQPNRPIQKVQLDLGVGAQPLPPGLIDDTIAIYEELLKDDSLSLVKNIQENISNTMRTKSIETAAAVFAKKLAEEGGVSEDKLLEYFLGKNEDILAELDLKPGRFQDKANLCKDQFSIFLPITLKYKRQSKYDRSDDGRRTIPCYKGEKHEAKFGTILEQMNYTVQDYIQGGITTFDIVQWAEDLKKQWDEDPARHPALLQRIQTILPGRTIADICNKDNHPRLIAEINKETQKILPFLKVQLHKLKTSGQVVSMDPQNIIDMGYAVSGISATLGTPEALHRQFKVDQKINGQIRANMALRLCTRALKGAQVLQYDPAHPENLLVEAKKNHKPSTIIDGAGLYNDSTRKVAKQLLEVNSSLKQVGYHSKEQIVFEGTPTGELSKTGFVFKQDRTRGVDIYLDSEALAVLTLSERDGFGEYAQFEGRHRKETQRYVMAISKYEENVHSIRDKIGKAICNDASMGAQDIFRKCKQELPAIVRKAGKAKLLDCETPEEFVVLFQQDELRKLYITPAAPNYPNDGSYYNKHKHLRKLEKDPQTVLEAYKQKMGDLATLLELPEAVEAVEAIDYPPELLAKMPLLVADINELELEMEHEVEAEEEQEQELEQQLEIQLETQLAQEVAKPVGNYPLRKFVKADDIDKNREPTEPPFNTHSLSETAEIPYNEKIRFSDDYLPLSRKETKSSHQRHLFDHASYRVGVIFVECDNHGAINHVIIEDPLEDSEIYKSNRQDFGNTGGFFYDLRTNQKVSDKDIQHYWILNPQNPLESLEFKQIVAQIKFFDGQMYGYTDEELDYLKTEWLNDDPEAMRDHFLNQILRNRYDDKLSYEGSQLHELFEELIP